MAQYSLIGMKPPGSIAFFDSKGEVLREEAYDAGLEFCARAGGPAAGPSGAGNRGTSLGLNM